MQNIKWNKRDYWLLASFIACSILVLYMAGDLIIHAVSSQPDTRGKIFDSYTGAIILCTNGSKAYAPQNGMCIDQRSNFIINGCSWTSFSAGDLKEYEMDNEMIERCCIELAQQREQNGSQPYAAYEKHAKESLKEDVIAIIKAMREPTDCMLNKVYELRATADDFMHKSVWQKMIDAVIGEN